MTVTIEQAIERLNSALEHDPDAVGKLMDYRVPCNEKLCYEHPHVQTRLFAGDAVATVGMLGLLNGIFGVEPATAGYIAVELDSETNEVIRFVNLKPRPNARKKE